MSAVILKTKQHYQKALIIEMLTLFGVCLGLLVWNGMMGLSFLMGSLVNFFAHCVFVYWIFFRKSAKNGTKMTAFYQGEALKWLVVIVLSGGSLKWMPDLQIIWFFVGFLMALLLNNVIPFVLSRRTY